MEQKILLTFDYELFLGTRSGTVENCLLRPTNMLLAVMKKYGVHALFFVDTVYLMRMEVLASDYPLVQKEVDAIKAQLRTIVDQGHTLCHHIHPHWLDATYIKDENQWDLSDTSHYCIESLSIEQRNQLFSYSVSFLSSIMQSIGKPYNCAGFRAGGLYIEPFSSIRDQFDRCGITNEYSCESPIEQQVESYRFTESTMQSDKHGLYVEYPISRIQISGLRKFANGLWYRMTKRYEQYQRIGDGIPSLPQQNTGPTSLQSKFTFSLPISIELLTPVLLPYYKQLLRRYSYIHFLSHPKLQSCKTIELFDVFLRYCILTK